MPKKGLKTGFGIYSKYLLFLFTFIVLFFLSLNVYSIRSCYNTIGNVMLFSPSAINISVNNLLLTVLAFVIIIASIIIFFSIKIKRKNKELQELNKQIPDISNKPENKNNSLTIQKEQVPEELFKSDNFFRMLLQEASEGITFFDREWKLIYANDAFYSSVGLDKDSFNVLEYKDILHPDSINYISAREQAISEKGFFESEIKVRHRDGNYLIFSARSVSVRNDNGEPIGTLTILHDISMLKKLTRAYKSNEASSTLESSFLANISHEIRTPLNSVVGFSNLLLANNLTKEVKEEYIEHINYNSEKLLQIIGDIIDLSRLESSLIEITYEEASLSSIVNEVVEDARLVIKRNEKSIILNVKDQFKDVGDLIFTDKIWLKRVLSHLMDNAIKFTLDGSVEVSYMLDNDSVVFKIKDTGIGIKKENLIRIFEEFRQEIAGHHRPFEGLGIGLTLAKEVVERMGGKIFVESEKGIGSVFSFSIPYRPAGSTRIKSSIRNTDQLPVSTGWNSRKCLIVDDNKDVLIYLSRILADTGIQILTARSGFEAIEHIKSTPDIDIVLLDMQMPEMNGIEATREIREIRKNLPIIAQTAFIFEDDKDIIIEAGCDACLIKPIRKDHLLTVMSGFIRSN